MYKSSTSILAQGTHLVKRTGLRVCRDLSLPIRGVAPASNPYIAGALANGDGDGEDEAAAKPAGKALMALSKLSRG